jgi:hypothetical protein
MCRAKFAKKFMPTPCAGCVNEPPAIMPANRLFEAVFARAANFRNDDGSLQWGAAIDWARAEGLRGEDLGEWIDKAAAVEGVLAKARADRMKQP